MKFDGCIVLGHRQCGSGGLLESAWDKRTDSKTPALVGAC